MWGCGRKVNEYGIRSSVCGTMEYYTSWMTLPNENVEIQIKYEVYTFRALLPEVKTIHL